MLRWSIGPLQILFTDLYPRGPFWPIWSKVFFGGDAERQPLTAWDIAQKYGPEKRVCFREAAIAILGAAAPITVASWNTPCSRVPLVRAYADLVLRGLNLHPRTCYARRGADGLPGDRIGKEVVITYMARRSSEWPERKFCDTLKSFFDCRLLDHLKTRKLGRQISNDKDVVAMLKRLETTQFANGAVVRARDVDFNVLSFEEQIEIDATTDVMIGPHGAGLMHNIFMPDRATLIELFVDGSSANRHFHNLAHWAGRAYTGKVMSNPVNIGELESAIKLAITRMDIDGC